MWAKFCRGGGRPGIRPWRLSFLKIAPTKRLKTAIWGILTNCKTLINMWMGRSGAAGRLLRDAAQALTGGATPGFGWAALTQRSVISVTVQNNQVDKAMRMLKRRVIEEGFRTTWAAQRVYTKPSQERKLAMRETEKRSSARVFKEKLRWIMRRKARGF